MCGAGPALSRAAFACRGHHGSHRSVGGARARLGKGWADDTWRVRGAVSPRAGTRGANALPFAGCVAALHLLSAAGALALPAVPAAAGSAASLREIQRPCL